MMFDSLERALYWLQSIWDDRLCAYFIEKVVKSWVPCKNPSHNKSDKIGIWLIIMQFFITLMSFIAPENTKIAQLHQRYELTMHT